MTSLNRTTLIYNTINNTDAKWCGVREEARATRAGAPELEAVFVHSQKKKKTPLLAPTHKKTNGVAHLLTVNSNTVSSAGVPTAATRTPRAAYANSA